MTKLRMLTVAGSLALAATGAMELAHHQAEHFKNAADYGIEAAFAAGVLLTLAGLYSLYLRQESVLSIVGVWAFRVAVAGQATLGVIALGTLMRGHDVLGPLFPLAVLAWAAGTVAFAVATVRASVLPRAVPVSLAVGTLAAIALNPGGPLVLAALWLVLVAAARHERAVAQVATA